MEILLIRIYLILIMRKGIDLLISSYPILPAQGKKRKESSKFALKIQIQDERVGRKAEKPRSSK